MVIACKGLSNRIVSLNTHVFNKGSSVIQRIREPCSVHCANHVVCSSRFGTIRNIVIVIGQFRRIVHDIRINAACVVVSVLLHVRRKISIVRFVSRCHLGVRGCDVRVFEQQVNVMLGDIAAN
ncbi:hypothetical protein D3C85_1381710 [compost metagenome]